MSEESDQECMRNKVREQQQNRENHGGTVTRVVPIVLPDGSTISGDIHSSTDLKNIAHENKLSKFEEGIENIHIEISEKVIEISENVEMISELQAESQTDMIENVVKGGQNEPSKANTFLPPIMQNSNFVQKSKLQAKRENHGTDKVNRL